MAKKFSKFLLCTAAIGTAAAAAYYYIRKKDSDFSMLHEEDDDYDDFSSDLDDDEADETASRKYVSLQTGAPASTEDDKASAADSVTSCEDQSAPKAEETQQAFTPLADQIPNASENPQEETVEDVEEFFDEEDDCDEEPELPEE